MNSSAIGPAGEMSRNPNPRGSSSAVDRRKRGDERPEHEDQQQFAAAEAGVRSVVQAVSTAVLDASLSPRRRLLRALHDTGVQFVSEGKETARADCLIARPPAIKRRKSQRKTHEEENDFGSGSSRARRNAGLRLDARRERREGHWGGHRGGSFSEMYAQKLNLTDAQKAQIADIEKSSREANKAFFEASKQTREQFGPRRTPTTRRSSMRSVRRWSRSARR